MFNFNLFKRIIIIILMVCMSLGLSLAWLQGPPSMAEQGVSEGVEQLVSQPTLTEGVNGERGSVAHRPQRLITGTDTFGYVMDDSLTPGGPTYNFEDIFTTGVTLTLGNDQMSPPLSIGFPFKFYDLITDTVYVSSNGFLTFLAGSSDGCCSGMSIPTNVGPDAIIAGWWGNLNPNNQPNIHHQTLGIAPNRYFIVQLTNVFHVGSIGPVTLQYKLFENTNIIQVHYVAAPGDGFNHTAGIENASGTIGLEYYFGPITLTTPLAVRYTPPITADLNLAFASNPVSGTVGKPLTYTVVVTNQGPHLAKNVILSGTTTNNGLFLTANSSQGSCTPTNQTLNCTIGNMLVNQPITLSLSLSVTALADGWLTTTFTATHRLVDPLPTNNTLSHQTPVTNPPPTTLLALYALAFDNRVTSTGNLSLYFDDTIEALRQGSVGDPNKQVVVLYDLAGEADNTGLHLIQNGVVITPVIGLPDQTGAISLTLGEYNMADGQQLGGFIKWARQTYPADQTIFSYIGHGTHHMPQTALTDIFTGDFRLRLPTNFYVPPIPTRWGVSPDFTDMHPEAIISPIGLAQALQIGNEGQPKIDVVDILHCFSGSIEELYELAPHTEMIVSGPNYNYFNPVALQDSLTAVNATQPPADLAQTLATAHHTSIPTYRHSEHPGIVVAIQSSAVLAAKAIWDRLSTQILADFQREALVSTYQSSGKYDGIFCEPHDWQLASPDPVVDLGDFAQHLNTTYQTNPTVGQLANQAVAQLEQGIITRHIRSGIGWFVPDSIVTTWNFNGQLGVGLLAPFEAEFEIITETTLYTLPFQVDWYTRTVQHPYGFITNTNPLSKTWADVIARTWPGLSDNEKRPYQTNACLPQFPEIAQITFNMNRQGYLSGPSKFFVEIKLENIYPEDELHTIDFTLVVSDPTIFSADTLNEGNQFPSGWKLVSDPLDTGTGWTGTITSSGLKTEGDIHLLTPKFDGHVSPNDGVQCTDLYFSNFTITNIEGEQISHWLNRFEICLNQRLNFNGLSSLQGHANPNAWDGTIVQLTHTQTPTLILTTTTDATGHFTFTYLSPGVYTAIFTHPLYVEAERAITLTTGQTTTLTVGLWAGDVDGDEAVTWVDWTAISVAAEPVNYRYFDVNADGVVTETDIALVQENLGRDETQMRFDDPPTPTTKIRATLLDQNKVQAIQTSTVQLTTEPQRITISITGTTISETVYGLGLHLSGLPPNRVITNGTIITPVQAISAVNWLPSNTNPFLKWEQEDDQFYFVGVPRNPEYLDLDLPLLEIILTQPLTGPVTVVGDNIQVSVPPGYYQYNLYLPIVLKQFAN